MPSKDSTGASTHPWSRRRSVAALSSIALASLLVVGLMPAAGQAATVTPGGLPAAADSPLVTKTAPQQETTPEQVAAIEWQPCGESAPAFECATYTVPRDYSDPSGATLELALTRLPATDVENRIGSLFLNPGGPGGSGVSFAQGAGAVLSTLTDGRFDIVGFDPRGVAGSTPVQCFTSDAERFGSGLLVGDVPDSEEELVEAAAQTAAYTSLCGIRNPENLAFVSTEFVARDLDLLRAAVGDEKLSYLGLSYGTILGATYANLFPDRVRALALDGAVNPEGFTSDISSFLTDSYRDSDAVLEGFFATCEEAGPELCALAGKDPQRVYEQLVGDIRASGGLPALTSSVPTIVTEDFLSNLVFQLMYTPTAWQQLAAALDSAATTDDGGALVDLAISLFGVPEPDAPYNNATDALNAVLCTDTGDGGEASQWIDVAEEVEEVSPSFGKAGAYIGFPCATWPAEAASRYAGPWDVPTANPVLILNPTSDPITPLASAQELDDLLADSRLLVQESFGHTTFAATSTCTLGFLRAYLLDQELPPEGTVCTPDATPFGVPTSAPGEPGPELPEGLEDMPELDDMRDQLMEEVLPDS
jgi:pimeloyl-ACP methyl ester carboxylesterase